MSVKVDLDQLSDALRDFAFAYLVTVNDDHRAHAVAVEPVLRDGVFDVGPQGNSTRRNAASHPDVTLVFPPRQVGGYTLIVDARAHSDGDALAVAPVHAVLHRPAPPNSPTASGCGDDCVPLGDH